MSTVTLTENFDLHVPEEIRKLLNLKPGEQFRVEHRSGGEIEFLPIRHPREMRGFARRMDTTIEREDEDRV